MSDNEKRAHDLALLVVDKTVDMYLRQVESEAVTKGVTDVTVDIDYYERYKRAYETALDAFNNDFPPDK